ncbi:hypothetical protein Pcinc_005708 [Petrolisthes cinctipes]|uniref:Uncharacterized protein n=1 Tax=Petrolisthes cinctipes TaxID=88211 RepID=A0AAE1GED0_PETCI|nr:hypothetical protein Pcinc_005708 [Petrolisthes cinctipes]
MVERRISEAGAESSQTHTLPLSFLSAHCMTESEVVLRSSVRTNKQTTPEMAESPADIASLIQLILNRDKRRQQGEL